MWFITILLQLASGTSSENAAPESVSGCSTPKHSSRALPHCAPLANVTQLEMETIRDFLQRKFQHERIQADMEELIRYMDNPPTVRGRSWDCDQQCPICGGTALSQSSRRLQDKPLTVQLAYKVTNTREELVEKKERAAKAAGECD